MKEHLNRKRGRNRHDDKARNSISTINNNNNACDKADVWIVPSKVNPRIKKYFEEPPAEGGHWLARPEVPSSAEIMDTDTNSTASSDIVELAPNRPFGKFDSKEDYLSTQYELLREDAVRPLREAVSMMRFTPAAAEDAFNSQIGIYENTHITAITMSSRGIAIRVTFSLRRVGKMILWEQSKRLISGTLVALTPADDMFQIKVIMATVAARPLDLLKQNPPEIDLFFARADELEIDPAVEYVMIENRGGFYEADKHTLSALQHMMQEVFPLAEHLVDAKTAVETPKYVKDQPQADLQAVFRNNTHETYENVDIVNNWPRQPQSDLDLSQLEALHRILTKRLAIVQGPPGTGKTYISVQAIKVMLANRKDGDPPIILACQTNHAVDQLLRHVAQFEPDFVRLGGRSKDHDVVKKRTLYEVRKGTSENPLAGSMFGMAKKRMKDIERELTVILTPLRPDKKRSIDHRILEGFKLLSKAQADSLEDGASQWIQDTLSSEARPPFAVWLGDKLIAVPHKQQPEEFGFDYEEPDLEFEQLKELEAENAARDDEDFESLSGLHLGIADNWTCRKVQGMVAFKVEDCLKEQDLWKIPEGSRASVYRYLQTQLKECITAALREKAKVFNEQALHRRIGQWEKDENILKTQKIIGMTTTGFSKYRALIAALQPRAILIEEAAETLEAPITATCVPSLQHLILVGDHQQLRPHTHVKAHEGKPYYLNVSLFERLVNNKVEYTTLAKQRRMIPEIRRLLYPIYKDKIKDHPSVMNPHNRPNVPGMGGVNSYFFTHNFSEHRDDQMSCVNAMEADMIAGFVEYLAYNEVDIGDITILTFYNGQRKRILSQLRQRLPLEGHAQKFNVVTVDSYQGEENQIVILSLVRSNSSNQIGFLGVDNRVCVALSRAQRGFYLFGNGEVLYNNSRTWQSVIEIVAGKKNKKDRPKIEPDRLGNAVPIRCINHSRKLEIDKPDQWEALLGGCDLPCEGKLACGHLCGFTCHVLPHEGMNCVVCHRLPAGTAPPTATPAGSETHSRSASKSTSSKSATDSWNEFATEEPKRIADEIASYVPHSRRSNLQKLVQTDDACSDRHVGQIFHGGPDQRRGGSTEMSNSDGTRKEQKEMCRVGDPVKKEDWSKQQSLLD